MALVWGAFNSHIQQSFSGIPVKVGGIKPEWSMFKSFIAEAVAKSYGLSVMGASRGSNPQISWWTPVVREAVQLKESLEYVIPWDSGVGL